MQLPQRIMTCYGYRFPEHADYDWDGIAGAIRLRGRGSDQLVMDLNYRDLPNGEVAVRVSREVLGQQYVPDVLPSIEPMPKGAEKTPSVDR